MGPIQPPPLTTLNFQWWAVRQVKHKIWAHANFMLEWDDPETTVTTLPNKEKEDKSDNFMLMFWKGLTHVDWKCVPTSYYPKRKKKRRKKCSTLGMHGANQPNQTKQRELAHNLTLEKSWGRHKAQHVTVTHPSGNYTPSCLTWLLRGKRSCFWPPSLPVSVTLWLSEWSFLSSSSRWGPMINLLIIMVPGHLVGGLP